MTARKRRENSNEESLVMKTKVEYENSSYEWQNPKNNDVKLMEKWHLNISYRSPICGTVNGIVAFVGKTPNSSVAGTHTHILV